MRPNYNQTLHNRISEVSKNLVVVKSAPSRVQHTRPSPADFRPGHKRINFAAQIRRENFAVTRGTHQGGI